MQGIAVQYRTCSSLDSIFFQKNKSHADQWRQELSRHVDIQRGLGRSSHCTRVYLKCQKKINDKEKWKYCNLLRISVRGQRLSLRVGAACPNQLEPNPSRGRKSPSRAEPSPDKAKVPTGGQFHTEPIGSMARSRAAHTALVQIGMEWNAVPGHQLYFYYYFFIFLRAENAEERLGS